jgi:hypothetical protein
MRTAILMIMAVCLACFALADTWTLTNGVPVTGTVVSSQVACVWIKTPLGVVRKISVPAFELDSRCRFPADVAGPYLDYYRQYRMTDNVLETAQKAVDKYTELQSKSQREFAEISISLDSSYKRLQLLTAELAAWREANSVRDASPEQRQAYVDQQIGAASERITTAP